MKPTKPTPQPAGDAFRWIPVSETPKVGGTYMAGKYVEDGVLPRRFQRFWTTLILTVDGPEWADPGVEYYYPLPPHPESETAYVLCMSDEVTDSVEAVAEIKMSRPSSELRHGDHRPEPYAAFRGKLPPVGTKLYTARAIQAGKGVIVDDAMVWRACKAYRPGIDTSALGVPQEMAEGMRAALEAALAGSQGEVVGDECPEDATNLEVIEHFIRVGRTMKPVGHWPGERLYAAIERVLNTPHRFIAEADKVPHRSHNGRGGDADQALPPFKTTTPDPVAPDGDDRRAFYRWWNASKYTQVVCPEEGWQQIALDAWKAALSKPRVGEAVGYQRTFNAIGDAVDAGEHAFGISVQRFLDSLGATALYTAPPTAIPDGMVVDGELERLRALLNTPELHDFAKGAALEAAHQRERWGNDHDAGKEPADWFWLLGYLAGKALKAHNDGNTDKALHHTISSAAVLANWHGAILGTTNMRPGIDGEAALAAPPGSAEGGDRG